MSERDSTMGKKLEVGSILESADLDGDGIVTDEET
jgi:hypothetical protein